MRVSNSSTSLHPEAVSITKRSNDTEKRSSNKYDTEDSSNTVAAAVLRSQKNAEYVGASVSLWIGGGEVKGSGVYGL